MRSGCCGSSGLALLAAGIAGAAGELLKELLGHFLGVAADADVTFLVSPMRSGFMST